MESMHPRALSAIHPQGAFHEWNQQVDRHKNQKNTAFRQDYSAWRRRQALARRLPLRKKGLAGQMEKRSQAGSIHHWPLSGYFTEAGQNGTGQDYRTAGSGN